MATYRITLEVIARPMTAEEAEEAGYALGGDEEPYVADDADVDGREIAELMASALSWEDVQSEMFAGSGMFVKIDGIRLAAVDQATQP